MKKVKCFDNQGIMPFFIKAPSKGPKLSEIGKASGEDGIKTEILKQLKKFCIEKLT